METKRLMISLMVLCCTLLAKAQNDVAIATLQHGDNVSVFKGSSALASALAAADEEGGDVITLSQGTFTAATITKPVSIYGAGFETDNSKGTLLTTISGNLTVGRDDNTTVANVHLEGFYLNGQLNVGGAYGTGPLDHLRVVKVKATSMYAQSTSLYTSFDQCVIWGSFDCDRAGGASGTYDFYFSNCFMRRGTFRFYKMESSSIVLDHCLINAYHNTNSTTGAAFDGSHTNILTLTNSVYIKANGSASRYDWPTGSNIQNCISDLNVTGFENCYQVAISDIFKNGENGTVYSDGTYSPERTFELTQPDTWRGNDGTEIGIRGGNGWSKVPSTPVVKSLSVTPSGTNLNVTYDAVVR